MHCVCVEMYYTSNIMAIVQHPSKTKKPFSVAPLTVSPQLTGKAPSQLSGKHAELFKENSSSSTAGRRSTTTVRPMTKKDVMMWDF